MKKLLFVLAFALTACSKDDPEPSAKYDSLEGSWAYTFPDNKVSFTFDLVKDGNGYAVQNSVVKYDGVEHIGHTAEFNSFVEGNSIGGILMDKPFGNPGDPVYNISIQSIEPIKSNAEIKTSSVRYSVDLYGTVTVTSSPVIKRSTD